MPSTKSRRPSLASSLLWYLPVLALIAIAVFMLHPLVLIPLLLANALAMAAICHAIGFDAEPDYRRTVLRRGAAWLVLFTGYTALTWLLIALPMVFLTTSTSLAGVLLLSAALALALAFLWRAWPAFGLAFLWDDAFPGKGKGSWILTAVSRCLVFARHVAAEERFFTHFLPAALATLALTLGALLLSGLYDVWPSEARTMGLWLYGLVLLPTCCLLIANRTLRALLIERGQRKPTRTPHEPEPPRERSGGPADTPRPGPLKLAAGEADAALVAAVRAGEAERAVALLQAGANPDTAAPATDPDQRSLLACAALQPDTHLLRALIAHGADVNRAPGDMSALLIATRDGCMSRTEAIMVLLANGAEVNATDGEGNSALHFAARAGDLASAAALVDAGARLDASNQHAQTALAMAARAGNWPMLEWLLERGAQATVAGAEPALLAAADASNDDPAGVTLLLAHKADVNATDALRRSALMGAALAGHATIVRCLLDARANPDLADQHGTTALMEAARCGASACVQALCEATADPSPRDRHGRDALTLACLSPHADAGLIDTLVQAGADPHAAAGNGASPADRAREAGRWDLLAVLDPSAELPASMAATREPDPDADSPEHLLDALRYGHWAIVGSFTSRIGQWPAHTLADLYLQLASPGHTRARAWLARRGLPIDARLADGRRLFDALLDTLPASGEAVNERLAAGVSAAGAGGLARAQAPLLADPGRGLALTQALLAAGADPFGPLADGRTPLHLATTPGWLPLLTALLQHGCDPNASDDAGQTPLHLAMQEPSADTLRALIAAGAAPEVRNANGETPLGLALAGGNRAAVHWLRWPDWPLPGRALRDTDLPAAAAAGDREAVTRLLQLGLAIDSRDRQGANALIQACGHGHRALAADLLENGADPAQVTPSGATALVATINMHQVGLIPLLLEHGAQVDQALPGGITALTVATARGHVDGTSALLDAGADVNSADGHGRTPLHAAARHAFASRDSLRCRRLLDLLLEHGANVNAVDRDGLTPLLILLGAHAQPDAACDATHLGALVPVLLDAGARHDHADARGVTALHACAMHALLAPARVLLARGADRTAVDSLGRRGADLARQLGYTDVALELDERGGIIPGPRQTLHTPAQPAD